jgi:uncharacterized BrkB/YihY/UPF0761 family membrane protein
VSVEERKEQKTRFYLVIFTVLFVLVALLSLLPATYAIRMFDAHGATENPATILLFLSFFSFPAFLLISVILAWIFYLLLKFRWALLILLLPLLNILGAAIGLTWLQLAYDGLFGSKL